MAEEERCRCDGALEDPLVRAEVEASMPPETVMLPNRCCEAWRLRYGDGRMPLERRVLELCEISTLFCNRCGQLMTDASLKEGEPAMTTNRAYWGVRNFKDADSWQSREMDYLFGEVDAGRLEEKHLELARDRGWDNSVTMLLATAEHALETKRRAKDELRRREEPRRDEPRPAAAKKKNRKKKQTSSLDIMRDKYYQVSPSRLLSNNTSFSPSAVTLLSPYCDH